MLRALSSSEHTPRRAYGLLLSFASAATSAAYLLAFRAATRDASADDVVLALLTFAALFNTLSFAVKAARNGMPERSAAEGMMSGTSLLLSALTVLGNFAAGRTIALLHPAVASVLMQTQVLFVAIAAYAWLGERVSLGFVVGALLALCGVGLMQWRDGGAGSDVLWGTAWGLCAALAFGLMQVVTRRVATRVDPLRFNAERLWLSVLWLALVPGRVTGVWHMSAGALALTALSAFFGPFLGRVALIYAARHVEAALTTIVGLLAPVVALGLSLLLVGDAPRSVELWGGAVVIVGTLAALRPRGALA